MDRKKKREVVMSPFKRPLYKYRHVLFFFFCFSDSIIMATHREIIIMAVFALARFACHKPNTHFSQSTGLCNTIDLYRWW